METIVRQVRELAQSERSTMEQLIGHALRENQQLVIQVMTVNVPANGAKDDAAAGNLPEWCNVYEGLSDEQVSEVESVALQRANLTRSAEQRPMQPALLDTDILSEVLKRKNAAVVAKAAGYLAQHRQFVFSALTRYEVLRGLKDKQATAQLQRFDAFCQRSLVLPITDAVLDKAADLWALAGRMGRPRFDADLIIAATAMEHALIVVTGNSAHFSWIPSLPQEDWRQP